MYITGSLLVTSDSTPSINRVNASAAGMPSQNAHQGKAHAPADNQAEDFTPACTKCDAHPHFAGPLLDAVGEDSVKSKPCEQECCYLRRTT